MPFDISILSFIYLLISYLSIVSLTLVDMLQQSTNLCSILLFIHYILLSKYSTFFKCWSCYSIPKKFQRTKIKWFIWLFYILYIICIKWMLSIHKNSKVFVNNVLTLVAFCDEERRDHDETLIRVFICRMWNTFICDFEIRLSLIMLFFCFFFI